MSYRFPYLKLMSKLDMLSNILTKFLLSIHSQNKPNILRKQKKASKQKCYTLQQLCDLTISYHNSATSPPTTGKEREGERERERKKKRRGQLAMIQATQGGRKGGEIERTHRGKTLSKAWAAACTPALSSLFSFSTKDLAL